MRRGCCRPARRTSQEEIDLKMSRRSTFIWLAVSTLIALAAALPAPAFAQEDLTAEQYEALSHALDMSIEEIQALGLSPDELQVLVDGFTEETVVVGSRGQPRTVAASSVPIDVLSTSDLTNQGVVNLQDQLRTVIPSFNVNTQPISDASTVVRPAMLRNLAPDHTLVLVNGKRRHRSSIIDWHGGNGVAYGSQGADISAIPSIALRQVEVLRDGAAAQYGSDAIAGVLNFQLKDAASGGSLEFNTGTFGEGDGEAFNVAGNVGLPLGATGFANLSLEYGSSNPTNRSAPRSDAIALLAAGNTHVASDTPQIWGSPEVDDDLKLFGNFGYTFATGIQLYGHTNYASKRVAGGFFFRNPNTRGGVFSPDGGGTLLVGDRLWAETGTPGAGGCPTVPIAGNVPDAGALAAVAANPNCFTLYERFPGGFTPSFGGEAQDMSVVGGVRGFTDAGFNWDASVSVGAHETDLFIRDTVNASLGYDTPTAFELGSNRQREIGVNFDVSYAATDMVNIAAGAEWRDEQYQTTAGDPTSWTVGPYGRGQGFSAGSNGFFGYGPLAAGTWNRNNVAAYADLEVNDVEADWTVGGALRVEHFEDFGTTTNGKVSARFAFLRASVSSGFRAPTPGQQNGFNISTIFDPGLGDLVNNGVIPSISPVAALRGGVPLEPERSINYTAGVVFDTGPFNFSADYFLIDVSDRIGITSNFALRDGEIASLLAQGIDSARDLRNFRFFTNAFDTRVAGNRPGLDLHADCAARQHRFQRGVQLHRHRSDRQREGAAGRPEAGGICLRAAARALERRGQPASGTGAAARPRELFRRLVRLGQRIQPGIPAAGRHRAGLLRRAADRRRGGEHRSLRRHDAGVRRAEPA